MRQLRSVSHVFVWSGLAAALVIACSNADEKPAAQFAVHDASTGDVETAQLPTDAAHDAADDAAVPEGCVECMVREVKNGTQLTPVREWNSPTKLTILSSVSPLAEFPTVSSYNNGVYVESPMGTEGERLPLTKTLGAAHGDRANMQNYAQLNLLSADGNQVVTFLSVSGSVVIQEGINQEQVKGSFDNIVLKEVEFFARSQRRSQHADRCATTLSLHTTC